jgi:hypothetical protein
MWKYFSLNTEDFPRLPHSVSVVNSDVDREMLPHSVSVVNCDADLAMLPHSVSFVITEDFPRNREYKYHYVFTETYN